MKTPAITTSMDRPVNLLRATTTCNTFYIFFSAAKAALLPFLTLFFRLVGLTAMDTGIVMAAKTLTGFVWAPLWARCAVAYNKRRLVLMFSLLMMGAMHMSFVAVYYKVAGSQICQPASMLDHQNGNASFLLNNTNLNLSNSESENKTLGATVTEPVDVSDSENQGNGEEGSSSVNQPGENEGSESPSLPTKTSELDSNTNSHVPKTPKEPLPGPQGEENNSTSTVVPATVPKKTISAVESNLPDKTEKESVQPPMSKRSIHRVPRNLNISIFNDLKDGIKALTSTLAENNLLLFLIVLLIVIFGEFFSSPVEKIADDAWFDFLERIDDMEKYGRQRYWGSLTFALVPIVVTCIVDYTPCKMMFGLHHFLMHFFVFVIFIALTLFIALYYPMPPPVKQKYSSKVGKGLRVICCDGRGFLFVLTLLVAGSVYASFHSFLFWRLQDLGSSEVTMGLCVSIGAFAETPMLVCSNKLVRKFGHGGVVSLSLLVLALRVLYYGFLWTPWAVLPAEVTNAFTHTALWYAVLSYDEFNVGSAMDRSIRSILSSMYFGLGFSLGSFVSGVVYHVYGASILFWGASVLSGVWCLVYSLIQCCLPKKERVKYIKLLRKEEDDSSEGDDDWLELALKDQ